MRRTIWFAIIGLELSACAGSKPIPRKPEPQPQACAAPTSSEAKLLARETADALATAPAPLADAEGERDAVLAAIRGHLEKDTGHQQALSVEALRVENDWAWIEVKPKAARGSGSEPYAALLEKQDARWVVVEDIERGGDLSSLGLANAARYVAELRKKYPTAPASVFPAL